METHLLVAYDGVMYHCFRYELGRWDRAPAVWILAEVACHRHVVLCKFRLNSWFPRGYNLFSKCSTNNRTCFRRKTIQLASSVTQKVNPLCLFAQNFTSVPDRPIGYFHFYYHSDGLNQRWRTSPDFWFHVRLS